MGRPIWTFESGSDAESVAAQVDGEVVSWEARPGHVHWTRYTAHRTRVAAREEKCHARDSYYLCISVGAGRVPER